MYRIPNLLRSANRARKLTMMPAAADDDDLGQDMLADLRGGWD